MKEKNEIEKELFKLAKQHDEIAGIIRTEEEKIPVSEICAGAVRKLILATKVHTLSWVLERESEEFNELIKKGEDFLINLFREDNNLKKQKLE